MCVANMLDLDEPHSSCEVGDGVKMAVARTVAYCECVREGANGEKTSQLA